MGAISVMGDDVPKATKAPSPTKVAFIAGTGKSGSTLLGKLLGQVDGFVDVGELINLDRQFSLGGKCGCGEAIVECGFWGEVLEKGIGGINHLDRKRWQRLKTRYMPLLIIPGSKGLLRRYFFQLHQIYGGLADVSRARVIVDSSKSAFYGAVLGLFPDVEVSMVHLVRDVRGSEGSMHRLKAEGANKWVKRNTWWNSIRWMIVNLLTEWTARLSGIRYIRVRYEDLVREPREALHAIAAVLNEADAEMSFLVGRTAELRETHTLSGSGVRFKVGSIELKLDERWKESLPGANRAVVDGLTRWFRRRYGY